MEEDNKWTGGGKKKKLMEKHNLSLSPPLLLINTESISIDLRGLAVGQGGQTRGG